MDAFTEIGVFVRVVELRSFTRAGRALGLTASGVSRVVSRLEDRLGVRLLRRTTRSLSLTDDGAAYFERCTKILGELEEANLAVSRSRDEPRGRLRVDAPHVVARHLLGPELPAFLARYPELSLDFTARDHLIDPVAEGVDVVVRMADPRESDLVSRRVGRMRVVLVASPGYLAKRGRPASLSELAAHETIGFLAGSTTLPWRFKGESGNEVSVPIHGRFNSNSSDAIRAALVAGLGLGQTLESNVRSELQSGALEVVMRELEVPSRAIYALYLRSKYAAPKVRAFVDFLGGLLGETDKRVRPRAAAR